MLSDFYSPAIHLSGMGVEDDDEEEDEEEEEEAETKIKEAKTLKRPASSQPKGPSKVGCWILLG